MPGAQKKAIFLGRLYKNAGEWGNRNFYSLIRRKRKTFEIMMNSVFLISFINVFHKSIIMPVSRKNIYFSLSIDNMLFTKI